MRSFGQGVPQQPPQRRSSPLGSGSARPSWPWLPLHQAASVLQPSQRCQRSTQAVLPGSGTGAGQYRVHWGCAHVPHLAGKAPSLPAAPCPLATRPSHCPNDRLGPACPRNSPSTSLQPSPPQNPGPDPPQGHLLSWSCRCQGRVLQHWQHRRSPGLGPQRCGPLQGQAEPLGHTGPSRAQGTINAP